MKLTAFRRRSAASAAAARGSAGDGPEGPGGNVEPADDASTVCSPSCVPDFEQSEPMYVMLFETVTRS